MPPRHLVPGTGGICRTSGLSSEHGVPGKPPQSESQPGLSTPASRGLGDREGRVRLLVGHRSRECRARGHPAGSREGGESLQGLLAPGHPCPPQTSCPLALTEAVPRRPRLCPRQGRGGCCNIEITSENMGKEKNELRGLRPQSGTPELCPAGPQGSGTGSGSTGRACGTAGARGH